MTPEELANRIRKYCLIAIHAAESGHPGGSLSAADIIAYLCIEELKWFSKSSARQDAGHFILSKGHACPVLYAAAAEADLVSHRDLLTLRKLGSPLQGHPHVLYAPWVETSTGSLGQGFSVAIGQALGIRYQNKPDRIYVMLGDGELQEGEIWEGVMCAGHYKLDNLCTIVDYNKMQSDDLNENIMGLEPLVTKWKAFNWHTIEIDGHNFDEIGKAFEEAKQTPDKPTVIIAHTVKGKGVSFMEDSPLWHGSVKLRDEDLTKALHNLGATRKEIMEYFNGAIWK